MTSEQLIKYMDKHNLSSSQLAALCGVSQRKVNSWMTQDRKIPRSFVAWLKLYERLNPPV